MLARMKKWILGDLVRFENWFSMKGQGYASLTGVSPQPRPCDT